MPAKIFAIKNLASSSVAQVNPWEVTRVVPETVSRSKVEFVEWTKRPDTEGCHYSMFEGLDPTIRVSGSNPAVLLHGLVADYDTVVTEADLKKLNVRAKSEHFPNWASRTFSGGARLLWLFEHPLPMPKTKEAITAILKHFSKKLHVNRLLPGFDSNAFDQDHMYYEVGSDWTRISSDPIPANVTSLWAFEACKSAKMAAVIENIPIAEVAKEVARRFPGRWNGPFEENSRGCRFWEAGADNPTAAVVRAGGMQCFTGVVGFISWRELLGVSFVEKYRANSIGAIINETYYDGNTYWTSAGDGTWIDKRAEDYKLHLRVKYGLSTISEKRGSPSEVELVLHQAQESNRVAGCMPFVHYPEGVVFYQGRRFLNGSVVRPLAPAPDPTKGWGDGFPYLAEYIDTFFEPADSKWYFLAWLKWFYCNARERAPRKGHALFIAGPPGVGKTLLSTAVVSRLVGGHVEAGDFLTGEGGRFTEHLFSKPLLTLDDSLPSASAGGHTRYTSAIKKLVANHDFQYEAKYGKAAQIPWLGRIIVTMNLDPEALRMLPELEDSIADKVCFFRAAGVHRKFPFDLNDIINRELPFLARWLEEWTLPPELVGEARYGTKQYMDPMLYMQAVSCSSGAVLEEIINIFADRYRLQQGGEKAKPEDLLWHGTSSALLCTLSATPDLEPIVRPYTTNHRLLGRELSKVASREGSRVLLSGGRGKAIGREWIIDCRADATAPGHGGGVQA